MFLLLAIPHARHLIRPITGILHSSLQFLCLHGQARCQCDFYWFLQWVRKRRQHERCFWGECCRRTRPLSSQAKHFNEPNQTSPQYYYPYATESVVVVACRFCNNDMFYSEVVSSRPSEMFVIPRVPEERGRRNSDFLPCLQQPACPYPSHYQFTAIPLFLMEYLAKAFQVDKNLVDLIKSKFRS